MRKEFAALLCVFALLVPVRTATAQRADTRHWSRIWGSVVSNEEARAVAFGLSGDVYGVGEAEEGFDGEANPGIKAACLSRFDADGSNRWTRLFGPTNSYAAANGVATLPDGSLLVVGQTWDGFGGAQAVGNGDFFLAKFTATGSSVWTRIWGSAGSDTAYAVAVDEQRNIYVAGSARGSVYGQPHVDHDDFCLSKFDEDGAHQWTRMWGSTNAAVGYEGARAVACDQKGNVYVAGFSDNSVDGQTFAGTFDIVLTKFTVAGVKQWTRMWGAGGIQKAQALAIGPSEYVYVAGTGGGFNGQAAVGDTDPFLMKVSPGGSNQWTTLWGSTGSDTGTGCGFASDGYLYVSGTAAYGATFDGEGAYDGGAFLTAFDTSGGRKWSKRWGAGGTEPYGLAVLGSNAVAVAGVTYGGFDGESAPGKNDLWVSKWGPPLPITITSGPFTGLPDESSIGVNWETSRAGDSVVRYGRYPGQVGGVFSNGAMVTVHNVTVTGLLAGVTYWYEVASRDSESNEAVSDAAYFQTRASSQFPSDFRAFSLHRDDGLIDLTAQASGHVDRVEISVGTQHVVTFYDPGLARSVGSGEGIFARGSNEVMATAYDEGGNMIAADFGSTFLDTDPNYLCEIVNPRFDDVIYTDTDVAPATNLLLLVHAAHRQLTSVYNNMNHTWVSRETWGPVSNVVFRVDSVSVHTSTVPTEAGGEYHQFSYDVTGLSTGRYVVNAYVYDGEGHMADWDGKPFRVAQRSSDLAVWRDVAFSAASNAFVCTVHIRNHGAGPAALSRLVDTVTGFQPCRGTSTWPGAAWTFATDPFARTGTVTVDGGLAFTIPSGGEAQIAYYAVPVLYPGGCDYRVGGGGALDAVDLTSGGAVHLDFNEESTTVGPWGERIALTEAVRQAKAHSDYLLVTDPVALQRSCTPAQGDHVLEKMGELATWRNGVIGHYYARQILRTSFREGDPVTIGRHAIYGDSFEELGIADVSENRLRLYRRGDAIGVGGIPLAHDVRSGDALAIGQLVNWNAAGAEHWRGEIAVASGNGHGGLAGAIDIYTHNYFPGTNDWTKNTIIASSSAYRTGGAMVAGHFVPTQAGDQLLVLGPGGTGRVHYVLDVNNDYRYPAFLTPFRSNDLVAAGDFYGDDTAEVVVGDLDADRLRVLECRTAIGSNSYVEVGSGSCVLNAEDGLAVGNVLAGGRDEIVVADASTDQLLVYRYDEGSGALALVATFAVPFEPGDRLLVGALGAISQDQALIVRASTCGETPVGGVEMLNLCPGEQPGDRHQLDALIDDGGEWARQLASDWAAEGFLLLVGETEVIPSFTTRWRVYFNEYRRADYMDREYADTQDEVDKPELAVGRIVGDNADAMLVPLQTSIDLASGAATLPRDRALCVAGEKDSDWFRPLRNRIRDRLVARGFTTTTVNNDTNDIPATLTPARDCDAIFFSGHGNWNVWDGIDTGDIDNFYDPGDSHPLVFAASCLTGRYAPGYSFAESFLLPGAAAYVGAVNNTYGYHDIGWCPRFAEAFFSRLQSDYTLGQSLKFTKRHRMSDSANTYSWDWNINRYHCAVFHLYGCPKVSFDWGGAEASPAGGKEATAIYTGPLSSLAFTVPDYGVESSNGIDRVTIPEGGEWGEPDHPVVPTYTVRVSFPAGDRVRDVVLLDAGTPSAPQSLKLPTATLHRMGARPPAEAAAPGGGFWPERDFDWSLEPQPDGSTLLLVTVYPFFHDPGTQQSLFYKDYSFRIDWNASDLDIERVATDRRAYDLGDAVEATLWLRNRGQLPRDVVLTGRARALDDGAAEELPLRLLRSLQGEGICRMAWQPAQAEAGDYQFEFEASDTQGDLLDRAIAPFTIGAAAGELRDFAMTPDAFAMGQPVQFGITFENTGSLPLEGEVVFSVQDGAGVGVWESRQAFSNLLAGVSSPFQANWTSTLHPRNGRLVVYAEFEGETVGYEVALDGSLDPLLLEVDHAADGERCVRWQSVAGRVYDVERSTCLTGGFTRVVSGVVSTPPWNDWTDPTTEPHAFYRILERPAP